MARKSNAQINIRSDFVRARAAQLSAETGKTITQVVEDAVRAYRPPPPVEQLLPDGLIRKGKFLVFKGEGGRKTTIEETLQAIEDSRSRDLLGNDEG